jgi:hypothetical protein
MIKTHWQYLKHVLKHKQLVFQEARRLGLPLWITLLHDWSKFRPSEWVPYVDYFWRMGKFPKQADIPMGALAGMGIFPKTKESVKAAFIEACKLHYQRNKHHWEHWGCDGLKPMPELYRIEMLADWWAVARALGNESPLAWYTMMKTEGRIVLHPETETWLDAQLGYSPKPKFAVGESVRKFLHGRLLDYVVTIASVHEFKQGKFCYIVNYETGTHGAIYYGEDELRKEHDATN